MPTRPLERAVACLRRLAGPPPAGDPPAAADPDLLATFAASRDQAAFAELVRRHGPMVLGTCRRLLGRAEDAEDAFQATFLLLARKAGAVRWRGSAGPWLYAAAGRVARNARRAAAARGRHEARAAAPRPPAEAAAEAARRELLAALDEELLRLPARLRAPLVLCHLLGATRAEAAGRLGWSAATLKRRLARGRAVLRGRLARRGAVPAALPVTLAGPPLAAGLPAATAAAAAAFVSGGAVPAAIAALARGAGALGLATPRAALLGILVVSGGLAVGAGAWQAAPRGGPDAPPAGAALDRLDRARIDPYELRAAGGGDPAKAPPELVAVLGSSRLRQARYVKAAAFSPDGSLVASAGGDDSVRLWDPKTGAEVRRFAGRVPGRGGWAEPLNVAFSPDGRAVAAGCYAGGVLLWDVADGRELRTLATDRPAGSIAFSPDGRLLATGEELRAQVWDLATGTVRHTLAAHAADFRRRTTSEYVTAAFAPDGKTLFVGHPDGSVRTWDVATGRPLRTLLEPQRGGVMSLALSRDGKHLAAGSREKTVRVWDADTGRLLHTLAAHDSYVQAVAFHPDGTALLSGGLDGQVHTWDLATGRRRYSFAASRLVGVDSLAFHPDGTLLASAGLAVRLWEPATGRPRFDFPGHLGMTKSLAFTPDGGTLVTGGGDGFVKLWDLATQTTVRTTDATSSSVQALAVSADGATIAVLEWGKHRVLLWDRASGRLQRTLDAEGQIGLGLALSPDGRWLAAACVDRMGGGTLVSRWDLRSDAPVRRLSVPGHSPTLNFTPDGGRLVVTSQHHARVGFRTTVVVYDAAGLQEQSRLEDPSGLTNVRSAALGPDGRTLALAGQVYGADDRGTGVVLLWDLVKGRPRLALDLGDAWVQFMDFAPDGRSLVTLSLGGTDARVWDPRDGAPRETIRLCEPGAYRVNAIRFAPDGRHLAAAMGNGTVYLLRVAPAPADVAEVTRVPEPLLRPQEPPKDLWKELAGRPAPEFRQVRGWLYGGPVRLAELRGRHVLLHFWNLESEQELAALRALYNRFGPQRLAVVVVFPDHGGTLEGLRKHLAELTATRWGGTEPPFPVALDGGGETPIAGTPLKAQGATHAAYRIVSGRRGYRVPATTLLIDPEGKVVRSVAIGGGGGLRDEFELLLGKPTAGAEAEQRFEAQYALKKGQVLRRVVAADARQRQDYFVGRFGTFGQRGAAVVEFDERPRFDRARRSSDQLRLRDVLRLAVRLRPFEVEGPADLLDLELAGDWVYRSGATEPELLQALAAILRDELKQPVRFEPHQANQDVIAVRGRWRPPANSAAAKDYVVDFHAGAAPGPEAPAGRARSLAELFRDLEDIVGHRVASEAPEPGGLDLRWRNHLGPELAAVRAATPEAAERLRALAANLARQTGLEVRVERQNVPLWRVSRAP